MTATQLKAMYYNEKESVRDAERQMEYAKIALLDKLQEEALESLVNKAGADEALVRFVLSQLISSITNL